MTKAMGCVKAIHKSGCFILACDTVKQEPEILGKNNEGRKINEKKKSPWGPIQELHVLAADVDHFNCTDECAFVLF